MNTPARRLLLLLALACATTALPVRAADATPADPKSPAVEASTEPKTFAEFLTHNGVKLTPGPTTVALGGIAQFKLSAGEHFVGPDALEQYCKVTENFYSPEQVGVIVSDAGWTLSFRYEDSGHVKDDEKDKLDAADLLQKMQEGVAAGNAERKSRGWAEMRLVGWAQPPHYDEKTNNLRWALNLASAADGYKGTWINESVRLLGRTGIMKVVLITENESFAEHSKIAQAKLASDFSYVSGQKYAEFKAGDKVAAYGLSALVLGGGAAVAAKMGWLAKLGGFFAKFFKFILLGLAALGGAIMKFFRKVTGREDPPAGPPTTTSS